MAVDFRKDLDAAVEPVIRDKFIAGVLEAGEGLKNGFRSDVVVTNDEDLLHDHIPPWVAEAERITSASTGTC